MNGSGPGPVEACGSADTGPGFDTLSAGVLKMDITSPFVVVPVIVIMFFVCILWATGGTADGRTADDAHPQH